MALQAYARRTGAVFGEQKALLGEQEMCSASRTQQTTPTTDFGPLLGEQKSVFGEQSVVPSKRWLNLGLSEKEPDFDENLRRRRAEQEINNP